MALLLTISAAKQVALIQHICKPLLNLKTLSGVWQYRHVALAHIVLMVTNTRQRTPQRLQVGVVAFVWLAGANSKNCAQLFRRFAAATPIKTPPLIYLA
jgi:hypothetical protein